MHKVFASLFTATFILTLSANQLNAQVKGGSQTKLAELFVLDRFEDCLFKSLMMVEKDKYRRDPEIYFYISMCYMKIFYVDPEELDDEYKDPIKDAMKWAAKAVKKDKEGIFTSENQDYLDDLKAEGIKQGHGFIEEAQFRKAAYVYKYIFKFSPEDYNILFMKGVCEILSRNTGEAERSLNEAIPNIRANYQNPDYRGDRISEPELKDGILMYCDYLNNAAQVDSAKATISFGMEFFGTDSDISGMYDKLHGTNTTEENQGDEPGQPKVFGSQEQQ